MESLLGVFRSLWDKKAVRPFILSLFALVVGVSGYAVTCTGCETVGVADPGVVGIGDELVDTFSTIYESSEDKEVVLEYLRLATMKVNKWRSGEFEFSDEDLIKIERLEEGIKSLMDSESPAYIRSRSKSLSALADSVGEYTHDEVEEEAEEFSTIVDDEETAE